jgi:FMN phosphatase YigB (HAD superfamily)
MTPDKLILTDCDGCLLDWNPTFSIWMQSRGHVLKHPNEYDISARYELAPGVGDLLVRQFNDVEPEIGSLPPHDDAVEYVRKLHHEHGYRFVVISSVSETASTAHLRRLNLDRVFGEECFSHLVCLKIGAKKDKALKPYENSGLFWIEDNLTNAKTGHEMGLTTLLLDASYNNEHTLPFPRLKNWSQIYDRIMAAEPVLV